MDHWLIDWLRLSPSCMRPPAQSTPAVPPGDVAHGGLAVEIVPGPASPIQLLLNLCASGRRQMGSQRAAVRGSPWATLDIWPFWCAAVSAQYTPCRHVRRRDETTTRCGQLRDTPPANDEEAGCAAAARTSRTAFPIVRHTIRWHTLLRDGLHGVHQQRGCPRAADGACGSASANGQCWNFT
jgi:hypothetical protein